VHGLRDSVLILGQVSSETLRDWYAASDVVLLTTHSEGLGRVLLEAQAMQRPVVAYDVGGVREAVSHGVTGFLVAKGDVGDLTERIAHLLADSDGRRSMGEQGQRLVLDRFTVDALAGRHEQFYAAVIGRSDAMDPTNRRA
jgi:glycosyltransferase involved in cell wall biosynthesis